MKTISLFTLLLLLLPQQLLAQRSAVPQAVPAIQYPKFPGDSMFRYLWRHLIQPEDLSELGVNFKLFIRLRVDTTGRVIAAVIQKSGGFSALDNEVQRVFCSMPPWLPARREEVAVEFEFGFPLYICFI